MRRLTRSHLLFLIVGVCLLSTPPVQAAENSRLLGQVRSQDGKPIEDAHIWVVGRTSEGLTLRNMRTDKTGRFVLGPLPPGLYSLRVSAVNYQPRVEETLRLVSGQQHQLDLRLQRQTNQNTQNKKKLSQEDWRWVLRTRASLKRSVLRFHPGTIQTAEAGRGQPANGLVLIGSATNPASGFLSDPVAVQFAYLMPYNLPLDMLVAGGATLGQAPGAFFHTHWQPKGFLPGPEFSLGAQQQNLPVGHPLRNLGDARVLRIYRAGNAQRLDLPAHLTLDYQFSIVGVSLNRQIVELYPAVRLERPLGESTVLILALSSKPAEATSDAGLKGLGNLLSEAHMLPPLTRRDGRLHLERVLRQEVGVEQHVGQTARLVAAVFRDSVRNATLTTDTAGAAILTDDFLPSFSGRGALYNGGNFSTTGMRVAYVSTWSDRLETMIGYVYGSGLALTGAHVGPDQTLRDLLETRAAHGLSARIDARLPVTGTRLLVGYRWVSEPVLTRLDGGETGVTLVEPYLRIQLRQPIPEIFFIPKGLTVIADAENILRQGTRIVSFSNGKQIQLLPSLRRIRGGLAYRF